MCVRDYGAKRPRASSSIHKNWKMVHCWSNRLFWPFQAKFYRAPLRTFPNWFYYSPLTSNIYLPAIPDIVVAFHKSTELIYLSVRLPLNCRTCLLNSCLGDSIHGAARHLYVQCYSVENVCYITQDGEIWPIAPMIWGTISDYFGRRPITAACLLFLSLSCIGLALVPTSAYWLLMVLRCLQAAGSASTLSIGNIYLCNTVYLLNVCRCWCDWRHIQSCRTW
jgi:MFS family permease